MTFSQLFMFHDFSVMIFILQTFNVFCCVTHCLWKPPKYFTCSVDSSFFLFSFGVCASNDHITQFSDAPAMDPETRLAHLELFIRIRIILKKGEKFPIMTRYNRNLNTFL